MTNINKCFDCNNKADCIFLNYYYNVDKYLCNSCVSKKRLKQKNYLKEIKKQQTNSKKIICFYCKKEACIFSILRETTLCYDCACEVSFTLLMKKDFFKFINELLYVKQRVSKEDRKARELFNNEKN